MKLGLSTSSCLLLQSLLFAFPVLALRPSLLVLPGTPTISPKVSSSPDSTIK